MVHLRSLGRIIINNNLLGKYDLCFSLIVTKDLTLMVRRLDNYVPIGSSASIKTVNKTHSYRVLSMKKPSFSSDNNLFRSNPLEPKCRCSHILEGFR